MRRRNHERRCDNQYRNYSSSEHGDSFDKTDFSAWLPPVSYCFSCVSAAPANLDQSLGDHTFSSSVVGFSVT
jgi:hypothetical protein